MKDEKEMTLTKMQLIGSVAKGGLTKKESGRLVENLLEIMKSTLENGEEILISGFGKFCVKDSSERRGRNPATGEPFLLDGRRFVVFRCSPVLREKINADYRQG